MNPWKEHNRPFPRHKNQFLPQESFEASFYLRWKANSEFFNEYSQQLIETDRIKFYQPGLGNTTLFIRFPYNLHDRI